MEEPRRDRFRAERTKNEPVKPADRPYSGDVQRRFEGGDRRRGSGGGGRRGRYGDDEGDRRYGEGERAPPRYGSGDRFNRGRGGGSRGGRFAPYEDRPPPRDGAMLRRGGRRGRGGRMPINEPPKIDTSIIPRDPRMTEHDMRDRRGGRRGFGGNFLVHLDTTFPDGLCCCVFFSPNVDIM